MVNFGLNSAAILGIFLAVAGAGLYFLRSIRPELSRDQDIFFAAVGLLCGGILLTNGWRLDPILQFGQFLLAGSTIFFGYEAIRLRGIATEQAKRNTRIVDEERPISNVYRYEEETDYDQIEPEEDRYANRRLRGTDDSRYSRTERNEADNRRPRSRGTSAPGTSERTTPGERAPRRRPRPTSRPVDRSVESWEADLENDWNDQPSSSPRSRPTRPPTRDLEPPPSRPRRRRPTEDRIPSPPSPEVETTPDDYVDYQPIDPTEYQPKDSSEEDQDNDKGNDRPGTFDY